MVDNKMAVSALRYMCILVMSIGLVCAMDAFINHRIVALFAFDVPGWVVGISASYMGLRYYRRLPQMEKTVAGTTFKWSNLSPFNAR